MTEAKKDNNRVPTKIGVLNTDGVTVKKLQSDPTTHILDTATGVSGSDFGGDDAARDSNGEPVMLAVSNADGITPVPLYIDSSNCLLIKLT